MAHLTPQVEAAPHWLPPNEVGQQSQGSDAWLWPPKSLNVPNSPLEKRRALHFAYFCFTYAYTCSIHFIQLRHKPKPNRLPCRTQGSNAWLWPPKLLNVPNPFPEKRRELHFAYTCFIFVAQLVHRRHQTAGSPECSSSANTIYLGGAVWCRVAPGGAVWRRGHHVAPCLQKVEPARPHRKELLALHRLAGATCARRR